MNLKQKADSVSVNQTNIFFQTKCSFQVSLLVNRDYYSGNILWGGEASVAQHTILNQQKCKSLEEAPLRFSEVFNSMTF